PSAVTNVGMNELWRGRYAGAVGSLERAAALSPDDYRIWANLGDAYRASGAPAEKASAAFARAITLASERLKLDASDAVAQSFLSTSYAKIGRARDAEDQSRQAVALGNGDPNVLMDAAVVCALGGRTEDAVGWIRKAVSAGYCAGIVSTQPDFASLRGNPDFQ